MGGEINTNNKLLPSAWGLFSSVLLSLNGQRSFWSDLSFLIPRVSGRQWNKDCKDVHLNFSNSTNDRLEQLSQQQQQQQQQQHQQQQQQQQQQQGLDEIAKTGNSGSFQFSDLVWQSTSLKFPPPLSGPPTPTPAPSSASSVLKSGAQEGLRAHHQK